MKKLRSLFIVMMALLVLTGCGSNTSDSKSEKKEDKTKTEEKAKNNNEKKNNEKEKENNKENKKENEKEKEKEKTNTTTSGDKLVCDISQAGQEMEMTITWASNKISGLAVKVKMDMSSLGYELDESMISMMSSMMEEAFLEQYGLSANTNGVKVNTEAEGNNTLIITVELDLNEISPDVIEKMNLNLSEDDLNHSYSELKEQAEAAGYNCH